MVEKLDASDAMYINQDLDGTVQANVHFCIPVDKSRTVFKDVEAHGIRCSEPWVAESTTAIAALQEIERASFHGRTIDVSYLRCEELNHAATAF